MSKSIAIDQIVIDAGTQFRLSINNAKVDEYAELKVFETPCEVFYDGCKYYLADGFHRYHAAKKAGHKKLACNVHTGTTRDAVAFAMSANARHGMHRSNEEKRLIVEFALADDQWVKLSNRAIAELCGVNDKFVGNIRKEIDSGADGLHLNESRTGKDGKQYKAKKPKEDDVVHESEEKSPEPPKPVPKKPEAKPKLLNAVEQALENAKELQPVQTLINELLRAIDAVPDVPGMELWHARSLKIRRMIEPAKGAVSACKPYAICPRCNGKKCTQCGNHGWVSSTTNKELAG